MLKNIQSTAIKKNMKKYYLFHKILYYAIYYNKISLNNKQGKTVVEKTEIRDLPAEVLQQ